MDRAQAANHDHEQEVNRLQDVELIRRDELQLVTADFTDSSPTCTTLKIVAEVFYVGDYASDIHLMLFSDASFAGDLTDSKSTSGAFYGL